MDHDTLRNTYREMDERPCVFEKLLLGSQAKCRLATRFFLAERIGVHCGADDAHLRCKKLTQELRNHSRFVLKIGDESLPLTHSQKMQIQVGGLRGLHCVVHPEEPPPTVIEDIHDLVQQAEQAFENLDALPFQEIIKQIAAYEGRKRPHPRK
jgi:hypothetical protein